MVDCGDCLTKLRQIAPIGDLTELLITLAQLSHPDKVADRYRNHLKKVADKVAHRFDDLCQAGAIDDAATCFAALRDVLAYDEQYVVTHSAQNTSDPAHALDGGDLFRVIDRREGNEWVVAALYIMSARAQGWDAYVLNFPKFCIFAVQRGGEKRLFRPEDTNKPLSAQDLRAMLKDALGEGAELSSVYYEPMDDRDFLIRLQNQVKSQQIATEDYDHALQSVQAMQVINPDEYRLLLDAGVLHARLRQRLSAIRALEGYVAVAPHGRDRDEALLLMNDLKDME